MPRQPKPYYRESDKQWVCTIDGTRIYLGKLKSKALEKFHQLMADREAIGAEINTVYAMAQEYLTWVEKNKAPATYDKVLRSLKNFCKHTGKSLKLSSLRGHHLTRWIAKNPGWKSTTTQNINLRCVTEMLNWCVKEGYVSKNPLSGYKKPQEQVRDEYYDDDQCSQILGNVKEPFRSFVVFLMETGCRPGEARRLKPRHMRDRVCVLPPEESAKGDGRERTIYPSDKAWEILEAKSQDREPDDFLFLNTKGRPWTKDSIKCAMHRIADEIGWTPIAYGLRHTWCTNALMQGMGLETVLQLMSHKDEKMVLRVYQKLKKNPEYLLEQANKFRSAAS